MAVLLISVVTTIAAVLWLITDFADTGPEPIALAGIAMTLGLAFLVGGSVGRGSLAQQKSLRFTSVLFLAAKFGFVAVAVLLPSVKTFEPDSRLYPLLVRATAFSVVFAFGAFIWGSVRLAWIMPTLDLSPEHRDLGF